MKKEYIFTGVIAIILSVIISVAMVGNNQPEPSEQRAGSGSRYQNGLSTDSTLPSAGEVRTTTLTVTGVSTLTGAVTTSAETITANGVTETRKRTTMTTSTTTPCALQSPSATTTLMSASVSFTTSSTSASIITIAKAASAFATTSQIGTDYAVGADAQATIVASTTPTGSTIVFAPSQWLVMGMQGGSAGNFSPVGACIAEFRSTI